MDDIVICDDTTSDRERLKVFINNYKPTNGDIRIHEYSTGESLLKAMQNIKFSVVFLDIQMEGLSGYETASRLRQLDDRLILVYYTGTADPSPKCFETEPYRYIKKNSSDEEIQSYVDAVLIKMVKTREIPQIPVKVGKNILYLQPDDIVYAEKAKRYLVVHLSESVLKKFDLTADSEIRIYDKMENFYENVKKYGFGWPHSSYAINFKYLNSCNGKTLKLKKMDNVFIITQSKAKEFNEKKHKFMLSQYKEGK